MSRERIEQSLSPALRVKGQPIEHFSMAERMRRYQVPGAAVAVIRDGDIEWTGEYGVTRAGGAPVHSTTLFQAASISKAVAAVAVLALAEYGTIDLDRDVNHYLRSWHLGPSEHTASTPVTARRLLSHTAGTTVPGFPGYAAGVPVPSVPEVLSGAAPANTPIVESFAAPGVIGQYSGGGSTIVQLLITEVTGRDFPSLMRDLVLHPFGMLDSAYDQPIERSRAARAAHGHVADGSPIDGGWHTYPELQAAGLWTTATDLAKWLRGVQHILGGRTGGPISPSTAALMVQQVSPGAFGLGPELGGSGALRRFGHSGSNAGFRSLADALVHGGSGMAIVTNADGGTTLCGEFRRAVAEVHGWGAIDEMEIEVVDIDPSVLQSYTGRFQGPFELRMRLLYDGGSLYSPAPYGRRRLFPLGPTTFLDEESGATLEFDVRDGHLARVAVLVGGAELMAFEPMVDDANQTEERV